MPLKRSAYFLALQAGLAVMRLPRDSVTRRFCCPSQCSGISTLLFDTKLRLGRVGRWVVVWGDVVASEWTCGRTVRNSLGGVSVEFFSHSVRSHCRLACTPVSRGISHREIRGSFEAPRAEYLPGCRTCSRHTGPGLRPPAAGPRSLSIEAPPGCCLCS